MICMGREPAYCWGVSVALSPDVGQYLQTRIYAALIDIQHADSGIDDHGWKIAAYFEQR